MTNLEKGVEISGTTADNLINNYCPLEFKILVKRSCDEQCTLCWEEKFTGIYPECWEPCDCDVCQKHEEICCVNKTDKCIDCLVLS